MSVWNFDALADKLTTSVADYFTYKEGVKTAKELQPLMVGTWQKTVLPALVIILVFFLLRGSK